MPAVAPVVPTAIAPAAVAPAAIVPAVVPTVAPPGELLGGIDLEEGAVVVRYLPQGARHRVADRFQFLGDRGRLGQRGIGGRRGLSAGRGETDGQAQRAGRQQCGKSGQRATILSHSAFPLHGARWHGARCHLSTDQSHAASLMRLSSVRTSVSRLGLTVQLAIPWLGSITRTSHTRSYSFTLLSSDSPAALFPHLATS